MTMRESGTWNFASMQNIDKSSLVSSTESGIIGGAMRFIQGLFGQRIYNRC